jgi:outer membrane protein assembly factor BamB/predicted MPP superfamily phosphohydrolase
VRGTVVDSSTGDGLSGVAVSDGFSVAQSGTGGAWSLDVAPDAQFVMVGTPATHQPMHEWFVDVRRDRPDVHDFALLPRASTRAALRLVHVTDLHLSVDDGRALRALHEMGTTPAPGVTVTGVVTGTQLRADLEAAMAAERPDLIVATGDLANHGTAAELAAYRDACAGLPVVHVPGNHDYLSTLTLETVTAFGEWWQAEGRAIDGLDPAEAFRERFFGGDWRAPESGRTPWLDVLGPMYYSFDIGDGVDAVHVVVYDGEGRVRYGDAYPQDRWLAADLAAVPAGRPVVALLHFAEGAEFFARFAGVQLVAALSGHWHADRVVRHSGALHVGGSTLGFGGIDSSPRGYGVVDMRGSSVSSRRVPVREPSGLRPQQPAGVAWRRSLAGTPAVGAPAAVADVLVTCTAGADGRGTVTALAADDGSARWSLELRSVVKRGLAAAGDVLLALTVDGELRCLDVGGSTRWQRQLGDPSYRWCYSLPLVDGDVVYAGGPRHLGCFAVSDGEPRWEVRELGEDWLASWCSPALADGVLVLPGAHDRLHAAGLDAATGEVRWRQAGPELASSVSPATSVGDTVVMATVDGWLRCVAASDGAERWRVPAFGAWSAAPSVLSGEVLVSVGSDGVLAGRDPSTGAPHWRVELGAATLAARSYERAAAGHLAGPTISGADVVAVGAGGRVVVVDATSGDVHWSRELGAPCLSAPAVAAGRVVVVTFDGEVLALDR